MDSNNLAARQELDLVLSLIYFDKLLPTDATLRIDASGLFQDRKNSSTDLDLQGDAILAD